MAWPLALLQPAWQERIGRGLVEGAIYPLVGACLVLVAGMLDPKHDVLARRVRLLRAAASEGQQRLQQVRRATEAMEKSTTA